MAILFASRLGSAAFEPQETLLAQRVKAAYLLHIITYTSWPKTAFPTDQAPVMIGILGDDSFGVALDDAAKTTNQKKETKRQILIRRFPSGTVTGRRHLVFVGSSQQTLNGLHQSGVLLVGERKGFCRQGGHINFILKDGKYRLEINVEAIRKAGLQIDSRLLSLKIVKIIKSSNRLAP